VDESISPIYDVKSGILLLFCFFLFGDCTMRFLAGLTAISIGAFLIQPVMAGTTFDQSLGGPGFYDGSGNPDGGFTVDNDNGVQIGLRAKYRQSGNVIDSSNDIYNVVTGPETTATTGNSLSNSADAAWNYEFSVNVGSGHVLSDYVVELTVLPGLSADGNNFQPLLPSIAHAETVSPLTYWSDNTGYDGTVTSGKVTSTDFAFQNSENPAFPDFPLANVFNMNANATYGFVLQVFTATGFNLVAQDSMTVVVGNGGIATPTPLPASVYSGTGVLGLLALGAFWRNRKNAVQA
jgi:hypothetical protein